MIEEDPDLADPDAELEDEEEEDGEETELEQELEEEEEEEGEYDIEYVEVCCSIVCRYRHLRDHCFDFRILKRVMTKWKTWNP
jgi:hypothetical protein